jgi:TonB family protein
MTIRYPLDAFETARPLRRVRARRFASDKLTSVGVTLAIHAVILAVALTAVHVAPPKVMQELSVQITPEKRKMAAEAMAVPKLAVPTAVTVPPPVVTIRTPAPPPVMVQQSDAKPVPPPVAVAQASAGEGRESFQARLLAQLNRFKQYPRAARQARIEGVVMLHFVMAADGRVQSFDIAKSSGRPVLDAEALALIQRAQPLPALPADYPTPTLDAIVPIEFLLAG